MRNIRHTLELLWWLLLSLIPAVIVIACFGGAWLSRRALRPVDEITGAARTIGIENLSQRLPVPQTGDELERLTDVWNTMLERLESAVTTLSQFAADASHELRTPLAVIRTSAELALRRARSTESYKESLQEIESEAARMTQLVEDLLFLARSDARTAGMPMAPVDLGLAVRDVATELRDLAELKGIKMHCGYPDKNLIVSGNAMALRRLLLVLLDNSIKYSHPGKRKGDHVGFRRPGHCAGAGFGSRDCGQGPAPHLQALLSCRRSAKRWRTRARFIARRHNCSGARGRH